ncbi:MAG TPA: D-alanyl-D-alanine carboxypeptidase family protein [Oscillospiraceae bacterium]|nr:D-alanyl-D-alanine carboxypeptidase family protein [Oscillospiraceae bacterium]
MFVTNCKRNTTIMLIIVLSLLISKVAAAETTLPALAAEAAVLIDAQTGQVLFEKNMHQQKYPASITKVMTGLIALEKGEETDTLVISSEAVFSIEKNSAHIALDVAEEITLEQALYALSIPSANDAANGIAEYLAGDQGSFARLMTAKAAELGAKNTNFVNAHGLEDAQHYTTAYDMAIIMMAAIKNPRFCEIFSETRYEILPTNIQPEIRYLHSTNALLNGLYPYEGIIASKSGWTSSAKHTLVTAAQRGSQKLIAVVLGCQNKDDRYLDTANLLDYGFEQFKTVTFDSQELLKDTADLDEVKKIAPAGKISRLLHQSLEPQDIKKTISITNQTDNKLELQLTLTLKNASDLMYADLGKIPLSINLAGATKNQGFYYLPYFFAVLLLLAAALRIRAVRRRRRRQRLRLKKRYWGHV